MNVNFFKKNTNKIPCRNGDSCKFYQQGNCRYYHDSKQQADNEKNEAKYSDEDNTKELNAMLPNKFRILSQNVWCIFGVGGSRKKERLKLLMEQIKKEQPEIICFQELFVFSCLYINVLQEELTYIDTELVKLGYIYNNKQTESFLFGISNGLMMYSKYKFEECKLESYNNEHLSFPKNIINKGLIGGIFKLNNQSS